MTTLYTRSLADVLAMFTAVLAAPAVTLLRGVLDLRHPGSATRGADQS